MPSQTHEPPAIIIISDNYKGFGLLPFREPDGTQTHDLQNRNLALYSTKLRVHSIILHACSEQSSLMDKRYVQQCKVTKILLIYHISVMTDRTLLAFFNILKYLVTTHLPQRCYQY